jgi:hypothetical protein
LALAENRSNRLVELFEAAWFRLRTASKQFLAKAGILLLFHPGLKRRGNS